MTIPPPAKPAGEPGAKQLDDKGRCCGRKPIVYKRHPAHLFCDRCDAAYNPETGEQVANWAYQLQNGGFVRRTF